MSFMATSRQTAPAWLQARKIVAPGWSMLMNVVYGLALSLFLLVLLRTVALIRHAPMVEHVQVVGAFQHIHPSGLAKTLTGVARGPILDVDLTQIRQVALQSPWVEQAWVSRIWPNRIDVHLIERTPVARWGRSGYLSSLGQVFDPPAADTVTISGLPELDGPVGQENMVMQQYLSMNALLKPLGLRIASLQLTDRMSWVVHLDDGVEIKVDNTDIFNKLQRFVVLYRQELQGQMDRVDSVDLRYLNGAAVAWKP